MGFACVFASAAGGGPCGGMLATAARAVGGMDLPWRRRVVRVTRADGREGWAALLPRDSSPRRVSRTVARLAGTGAGEVSLAPRFGLPCRGLHLWMAACLRAALLLASVRGTPARALVVGADTAAGRLALSWLGARLRHICVGDAPGWRHMRDGDRLLADLGVAVRWDPVDGPGPPWEGDLVVWAGESRILEREVRAPVWLGACWVPCSGTEMVVEDALLSGPGMKGIPAWWWKEWGWREGFLPAGGLEAALGGAPWMRAHPLDRVWRAARERGWSLAGALVAQGGQPGRSRGAGRVVWLTGMEAAHIIGNAID
ncbi:MAG: hypothetical protein AB1503_03585 [Bacillota bacterium]|nr:hypothetical protein [Bacillota bacterium]